MDNKFDRNTFESSEFLIESTEAPKIKAGGSSSSNILNRFFDSLGQDITLLATRTNVLAQRSNRIENGCAAQSGALSAAFASVSARVDAASGYSQVLCDIHDAFYVSSSTTAELNYIFGQATLPIVSQTDLLVQLDVYGNKYVSSEVELSYAYKLAAGPSQISLTEFQVDSEGIFMLRDDQVWIVPADNTKPVWFKLKAPLQFRGLVPNVMELWPFPALGGVYLKGIWYQVAGDSNTGTWYNVDLTYLPGYNSLTSRVDNLGPIRIFLPNVPISQVVFAFNTVNDYMGVKKLKFYHTEYESTAQLVVKDPYNRVAGDLTLRGKDPSDLSHLTVVKSGNQAQITLTTTDATTTPVITGAIMKVT